LPLSQTLLADQHLLLAASWFNFVATDKHAFESLMEDREMQFFSSFTAHSCVVLPLQLIEYQCAASAIPTCQNGEIIAENFYSKRLNFCEYMELK
jgi:hypothetical protein